jgi:hypothetical protein
MMSFLAVFRGFMNKCNCICNCNLPFFIMSHTTDVSQILVFLQILLAVNLDDLLDLALQNLENQLWKTAKLKHSKIQTGWRTSTARQPGAVCSLRWRGSRTCPGPGDQILHPGPLQLGKMVCRIRNFLEPGFAKYFSQTASGLGLRAPFIGEASEPDQALATPIQHAGAASRSTTQVHSPEKPHNSLDRRHSTTTTSSLFSSWHCWPAGHSTGTADAPVEPPAPRHAVGQAGTCTATRLLSTTCAHAGQSSSLQVPEERLPGRQLSSVLQVSISHTCIHQSLHLCPAGLFHTHPSFLTGRPCL